MKVQFRGARVNHRKGLTNLRGLVLSGLLCAVALGGSSSAQEIYYADRFNGAILRSALDGLGMETVLQGLSIPDDIAIDPLGRRIYFTTDFGSIHRAYLDSDVTEELLSGSLLGAANDIAVDSLQAKLYYMEFRLGENARIRRMNLDGSGAETVFGLPIQYPRTMVILPIQEKVYWIDPGVTIYGGIRSVSMNGSGEHQIVAAPQPLFPSGGECKWVTMAVSESLGKIFYFGCGQFYSADLDGSNPLQILEFQQGSPLWTYGKAGPISIDEAGGKLYFSADPDGDNPFGPLPEGLYRCNFDGSSFEYVTALNGLEPRCIDGTADQPSSIPTPLAEKIGSRYLAVTPAPGKNPVALKVVAPANQFVQADGTLGTTPISQLPSQWGTVYVRDAQIVPSLDCEVRTIYMNGPIELPSDPGMVRTGVWGDTKEPGNGIVNLDDILEVLVDFGTACSACPDVLGSDLVGINGLPDGVVTLDDILAVLVSFAGHGYPNP